MEEPMVKRAITLGGGGPAAGLHIGVLESLAAAGITFDVWALSCIGAWVGIVYNQFGDEVENKKIENKDRAELTYQFFKNGVFRDDESYERFPINTVFGPDWRSNIKALNNFVTDRDNYKDFLWDPYRMMDSFQESMSLLFSRIRDEDGKKKYDKLDEGDINGWILNHGMAPNPLVRYLTSMTYLSNVTGLSRINYPNSEFMKRIKFENLFDKKTEENDENEKKKPFIFHNAWNLDRQKLALFSNRPMRDEFYQGPINASTLCACSALPFIEETVKIGEDTYCEGALVDTVNFRSLIEEAHPEEIWVVRIVDSKQVRKPVNLHDSLANLCQLFAATVGEDDVKLFKYHVQYDEPEPKKEPWRGVVVEIHVPAGINFKWNHSNLDKGRRLGRKAAVEAIAAYQARDRKPLAKNERVRFINERKDGKKGRHIEEDRLAQAIALATGTRDPEPWSKKMESRVDAKSGKEVEQDGNGKYPKGSIPYPEFAMRNPEVKAIYDRLSAPGLKLL
jgi:predicted acylesterase/phospholipase RssA